MGPLDFSSPCLRPHRSLGVTPPHPTPISCVATPDANLQCLMWIKILTCFCFLFQFFIPGETLVPISSKRGRCTIWPGQPFHIKNKLYHMWVYTFSLLVLHVPLSEPFLTSSSCCDRPARPSSVSGAELCTIGPSAAECFVQHNTKPARMWRYRSSCPIVSEGEKMSTESVKKKKKCRIAVSSLGY